MASIMTSPLELASPAVQQPEPFLRVQEVRKRFGAVEAVAGVSLDIREAEVFTLLGPSGCGKTTLLRLIAGLEVPDEGEIHLTDSCLAAPRHGVFVEAERRNMGMVFQSHAVWPHMTVYQNVAYPLQIRHVGRSEIRDRVFRMLELVGLGEFHDRPATRLSGGQQQRVALARALVYSPHVLLLDEPLSSLDARLRDDMRRQIRKLQRQLGVTVVFVTHDQREAFSMSDHVAVLRQGKLEQLGTPQEVYLRPSSPYVRDFLGRSLVLQAVLTQISGTSALVMIEDMAVGLELPLPPDAGGDDLSKLTPGTQVKVTIRPEYLRVAPKEALGRAGCVSARVEEILYLGEGHEYMVSLGSHKEVITLPGDLLARPGEQIVLELDPAAMTLWPD